MPNYMHGLNSMIIFFKAGQSLASKFVTENISACVGVFFITIACAGAQKLGQAWDEIERSQFFQMWIGWWGCTLVVVADISDSAILPEHVRGFVEAGLFTRP